MVLCDKDFLSKWVRDQKESLNARIIALTILLIYTTWEEFHDRATFLPLFLVLVDLDV